MRGSFSLNFCWVLALKLSVEELIGHCEVIAICSKVKKRQLAQRENETQRDLCTGEPVERWCYCKNNAGASTSSNSKE